MVRNDLLVGARLRLTRLEEGDAAAIAGWERDSGFLRLFDSNPAVPRTFAEIVDEIKKRTPTSYHLGIRTLDENRLIGLISVSSIEWNNAAAEVSIGIGDVRNRGQGYGREAMEIALRFAFDELNLYRISLGVFEYNAPAIALYEKLGFKREGAIREYVHRDRKRYDLILLGLLRPEWEAYVRAMSD